MNSLLRAVRKKSSTKLVNSRPNNSTSAISIKRDRDLFSIGRLARLGWQTGPKLECCFRTLADLSGQVLFDSAPSPMRAFDLWRII